jgi:alpha-L-fucosidase
MRDEIFRTNLLKGSRLTNKGKDPSVLFDGRDDSFLNPPSPDSVHIIELVLPRTATFNVLVLQENIRKGQRVEKFVLECSSHGAWKTVCSGTTIGYKRIIPFDTVSADRVRLRILLSRLTPAIAEFGLYLRK